MWKQESLSNAPYLDLHNHSMERGSPATVLSCLNIAKCRHLECNMEKEKKTQTERRLKNAFPACGPA